MDDLTKKRLENDAAGLVALRVGVEATAERVAAANPNMLSAINDALVATGMPVAATAHISVPLSFALMISNMLGDAGMSHELILECFRTWAVIEDGLPDVEAVCTCVEPTCPRGRARLSQVGRLCHMLTTELMILIGYDNELPLDADEAVIEATRDRELKIAVDAGAVLLGVSLAANF